MGRKKHLDLLREFKRKLSKKILIKKMVLFGSRAKGKPKRWSDFDLVIVSDDFEGKDTLYRSVMFRDYWDIDYPVDFFCYTSKEFDKFKDQIAMLKQALGEGIEIK